jgi:hypothetical protein
VRGHTTADTLIHCVDRSLHTVNPDGGRRWTLVDAQHTDRDQERNRQLARLPAAFDADEVTLVHSPIVRASTGVLQDEAAGCDDGRVPVDVDHACRPIPACDGMGRVHGGDTGSKIDELVDPMGEHVIDGKDQELAVSSRAVAGVRIAGKQVRRLDSVQGVVEAPTEKEIMDACDMGIAQAGIQGLGVRRMRHVVHLICRIARRSRVGTAR